MATQQRAPFPKQHIHSNWRKAKADYRGSDKEQKGDREGVIGPREAPLTRERRHESPSETTGGAMDAGKEEEGTVERKRKHLQCRRSEISVDMCLLDGIGDNCHSEDG